MATAKASIQLQVSPDDVWELIGGFGSLPDWLPYIPKSVLSNGGRVRHLDNPGGESIVERLERYNHAERSYSYSILHAPFPVVNYISTISVTPNEHGGGCRVDWTGMFTPVGTTDDEVHNLFQGIYADGLKALSAHYAKP